MLQLNEGEIRVAEYLTALPARSVLEAKLHDAVLRARQRLETHLEEDSHGCSKVPEWLPRNIAVTNRLAKNGQRPAHLLHARIKKREYPLPRRQPLPNYRKTPGSTSIL